MPEYMPVLYLSQYKYLEMHTNESGLVGKQGKF